MRCCKKPKHTFSASLVGVVSADWQKSGLNLKIPRNPWFCPLGPPTKRSFNFLIIIAKVGASQTFFMQKICFQRVWFRLCSQLNGRNKVL